MLKVYLKGENIMRKGIKASSALLCFLLIFSCILSPLLSADALAVTANDAFFDENTSFDYKAVSLEPKASSQSTPKPLSEDELKNIKLYPGGVPFGVKFLTEGILVVGFSDKEVETRKNPSLIAGLKVGDRIISVNNKSLVSSAELCKMVEESQGRSLSLVYSRNGKNHTTTLTPFYSQKEKCYKTGVYVKDNGAGIGTVTYITPNSLSFGGLGHGICEGENGRLVPISRGTVLDVSISGVQKGLVGNPGEVKGYFNSAKTGSLLKNTDCGVFGVFTSLPKGLPSQPLSLKTSSELREGKAFIYCTLDENGPEKYEIEISSIDRNAVGGKCFTVKVTDSRLLEKSGGIVQGMSGSPIIQDGKLCGAVTHVLINDPTTGYGIFIENMLAQTA